MSVHLVASHVTSTNNNKSSAVAETGDHFVTTDMGRKVGGCCASFHGRELGPHLTQCRLPPYQVASWSTQPCGHFTQMLQTDRTDDGPI